MQIMQTPSLHGTSSTFKGGLLEASCWAIGLGLLALMDPEGNHLFSFCPWSWVLNNGCPGCGLGHSIAFLFRGEWQASWEAHRLGLPALLILSWRIQSLLRQYYLLKHNQLTHNHHAKRLQHHA